ncbi:hypothetical protein M0805_005036 [Coniferiporia weirii]|nr:hypothetical protein M0805_005036 [Coniferiporia weirii]
MAGLPDAPLVDNLKFSNSPRVAPPPGSPVTYLQLSDLRTKRRRASDPLTVVNAYEHDTSVIGEDISDIDRRMLQSGLDECLGCVVDCDGQNCHLSRSPVKEQCTEQCVVVPCDDQDACADVCLEETCQVEPCDGGDKCTGNFEELFQCCTDWHAYTGVFCSDPTSSHLNWNCSTGDFFVPGIQNYSGYSQASELDAQIQAFSSLTFSGTSLHPEPFGKLPQGTGSPAVSVSPSNPAHSSVVGLAPPHKTSKRKSPLEFMCRWSNCNESFVSLNELAGHVNHVHLRPPSPTSRPAKRLRMDPDLSCRWDDCQIYPESSTSQGPSTGLQPEAALDLLLNHLYHDHLGLSALPNLLASDTDHNEGEQGQLNKTGDFVDSWKCVNESTEVTRSQTQPPPSAGVPSELQPTPTSMLTYSTPAPSPPPLPMTNEAVHDCAAVAHVCHWENCCASFDTCAALTEHLTAVHVGGGKSRYDCHWTDCTRSGVQGFASKQKILRHLQAHTGHRPFACSECGLHFSEAATLQQHMRRHTQERPFLCDFPGCGKAFAITGALTIHKRTHNGERPFKCPHCNRAFAESSNLSKHLRTHTGDRPYRCAEPGCGKAFARPDQLQRHGNVHMKKRALTVSSEPTEARS